MSWRDVSVGEVCDLSTGGTPSKENTEYFDNGDILWLVSGDIHKREIFDCNGRITELGYKNSNAKFLPIDSVLIALNGQGKTRGTVALLRVRATCNQSIVAITPKNKDELDSKYLFYYLDGKYEYIRRLTGDSGTDSRGLNMPLIRKISLPIPPLKTQQKIVAKLDVIFAEIDKATVAAGANAKNSQSLFQSYLTQVFERGGEGFLSTTLGNFYDVRDGTHDSPKFHESGYPLVTSKNLKNGAISFEKIQYVSKDDYLSISQRSGVKKGDVLMAMIGTIGNPVVIETDAEFAIKNVALFKTNNNQSPHFLRYYLGSDYVVRKMEKDAKGATQKFVGLGYLRSFPINVPPFDIQISVVKELEDYERHTKKLFSSYLNKLNQLLNLKQSILKQAFSGELVKE